MNTYLSLHRHFKILIILLLFVGCEPESVDQPEIKVQQSPDYYDFSSEKEINVLGDFELKVSDKEIIFNAKHGNLDSPLRYNNDLDDFNFNGIYKLTDSQGAVYYFRFGWMEFEIGRTIFSDVEWLQKMPPQKETVYNISTVEINFVQEGYITVSTIGDSQTWWKKSQNLRRKMDRNFQDLLFVGSNTDIYGYPHEGEGGNTTQNVIERFEYIPEADIYTVLLGANDFDHEISIEKASDNLIQIFTMINNKYPESEIIYISPFPSPNEELYQYGNNLQESVLNKIGDLENIYFFNFKEIMVSNENWKNEYFADIFHLNEKGVELLAKELSEIIKSDFDTD